MITQSLSSVRDSQQVATLSLDQLGLATAPQEHTSSSRLGYRLFPMNILNWNVRGLNSSRSRQLLRDLLVDNKIDVVAIQETKKETFTNRCLKGLSTRLDNWV